MKAGASSLRYRYRRILTFFLRAILTFLWWDLLVRRMLGARLVNRLARDRYRRIARQFRTLAVEMGGVLIKLGQFLSVHVELLPTEVTQELAGLQDEVPAEAFAEIRVILEEDLQAPLAQRFRLFEERAHAAASLGQVHRACLPNGAEVMVKVQRPRIREMVETDLAALRTVIGWLQRYPPIRRRADLEALFEEFRRTLFEELDYLTEGRNAEQFADNFQDHPGVRVPAVHWSHTTRRVLTLEDVTAIKITDYAAIEAAGVSRQEVARRLMETYLQQIFRDGFFHADPHPGNLFVQPLPWPEGGRGGGRALTPDDGKGRGGEKGQPFRLVFVDFGMVGRVTPEMREHLREAVIALATRDAQRLVRAYQALGMLLPGADLDRIAQAEQAIMDRYWGKSLLEMRQIDLHEVRELAWEFRDLFFEMPFQIPSDLLYLGRTLGILSGLAVGLDPDFNVWEALQPFAQELVWEEVGRAGERVPALLLTLLETLRELLQVSLRLPGRMDRYLDLAVRGELTVQVQPATGMTRSLERLERSIVRLAWMVGFVGLLLAGVQSYGAGLDHLGVLLLAAAFLALMRFLWLARQ